MKRRRGQSSMEFLAMLVFLMIALVTVSYSILFKSTAIIDTQREMEANRLLKNAADKINTAFIEGDGFSINVTLPYRIYEEDYYIETSGNQIRITAFNKTYDRFMVTGNITGSFQGGLNRLENINGVVAISQP